MAGAAGRVSAATATIWHNPRCSKSRQALALLEEAGAEVTVREYLEDPPSPDELRRVLARGGLAPRDVLRRGEEAATDLADATDDEIVDAMMLHPILIERPIIETAKGVVVARPPERVRDIL